MVQPKNGHIHGWAKTLDEAYIEQMSPVRMAVLEKRRFHLKKQTNIFKQAEPLQFSEPSPQKLSSHVETTVNKSDTTLQIIGKVPTGPRMITMNSNLPEHAIKSLRRRCTQSFLRPHPHHRPALGESVPYPQSLRQNISASLR